MIVPDPYRQRHLRQSARASRLRRDKGAPISRSSDAVALAVAPVLARASVRLAGASRQNKVLALLLHLRRATGRLARPVLLSAVVRSLCSGLNFRGSFARPSLGQLSRFCALLATTHRLHNVMGYAAVCGRPIPRLAPSPSSSRLVGSVAPNRSPWVSGLGSRWGAESHLHFLRQSWACPLRWSAVPVYTLGPALCVGSQCPSTPLTNCNQQNHHPIKASRPTPGSVCLLPLLVRGLCARRSLATWRPVVPVTGHN